MASILNATTSSGLVTSADNSGSLQLATNNGTTAVTIDTSQNVGIGTTSPSYKLDVNNVARVSGLRQSFQTGLFDVDGTLSNYSATNGVYLNGNAAGWLRLSADGSSNTAASIQLNGASYSEPKIMVFFTNNTERMRIDSSGNVMVGTTSVTSGSRFQVKGSTTTDAVVCFLFQNSASTTLFAALNSGQLYTGSASGSPYNNTTGSGANVFVASDGLLQRSTSSLKYKTDVIDATHGLTDLLKLRSVTYKGKNDGGTIFGGLIAEEVHEAGLTEFVQYAEDGSPDALSYGNMVSLCVKAIQELKAELDATKAEVAALKGTL